MSDTPRTDAIEAEFNEEYIKSHPPFAKWLLRLGDHARVMERLAKRWQEIADKRAIEVADPKGSPSAAASIDEQQILDAYTAGVLDSGLTFSERQGHLAGLRAVLGLQSAITSVSTVTPDRHCLRAMTDGRCSAPDCMCPILKASGGSDG